MKSYVSYKHDTTLFSTISDNTVKCKCGHSVDFLDKSEKKIYQQMLLKYFVFY